MAKVPITEAHERLPEWVERTSSTRERVVITDSGAAVAVLISPEELAHLDEGRAVADYLMREPNDVAWARLGLRRRK